jgi:hypothetical protein
MFQRFTDKARRTVVLAQEEARALRHDHIGTEHLLLGLLRESAGVAATALTALGIGIDEVRARVAGSSPGEPGQAGQALAGHIPFTPQAKRALERALREAMQLGHDYIGTEHILLGLVRDADDQAAEILSALGADQAAIRARVIELRPARQSRPPSPRASAAIRQEGGSQIARWRVTALGQSEDIGLDVADLVAELGLLRREKESAIDAKDFRRAEALSDLLVHWDRRTSEWVDRASLVTQIAQLRAEVDRLRSVLRAHGLDAG